MAGGRPVNSLLAAFQYQEKDTLLHRLDPRAKILVAAALFLFLWMRTDLHILALAVVPLVALVLLGGLTRRLLPSLRFYGILGLFLVPGNALLHSLYAPLGGPEPTVLLQVTPPGTFLLGELFLTREAFAFSLWVYVRLILMLVTVNVFVMSTDLDEVEALLYRLRFPDFFVLTLGFAFRFLPTLAEEASRIRDAQRARGLDPKAGGPLRRTWNSLIPVLMPLIVNVLRRSLRLAEALETRATFVYPRRTSVTDLTFRGRDVAVSASALAILGLSFTLLVLWPVL